MQKIFLKGCLGQNAEIVPNGERQQLKFRIACNYGKGEKVNTTWYDVFFFKTQLQQYLLKGTDVLITGRLDVRRNEGKDGKVYVNLTVYADDLEFCGNKKSQDSQPRQQPQQRPQPAPQPVAQEDDGLPF